MGSFWTWWSPLFSKKKKCLIMSAWHHQLVPTSGHVKKAETARKLQLYTTYICLNIYQPYQWLWDSNQRSDLFFRCLSPDPIFHSYMINTNRPYLYGAEKAKGFKHSMRLTFNWQLPCFIPSCDYMNNNGHKPAVVAILENVEMSQIPVAPRLFQIPIQLENICPFPSRGKSLGYPQL